MFNNNLGNMIKKFNQISLITSEGRYLTAAIDLLITESNIGKTRDEVVQQLSELVDHRQPFYPSEELLSDKAHFEALIQHS